jgi:transcription elongation factor Elf1
MTENLWQQPIQCPGCGEEHSSEIVNKEFPSMFGTGTDIEGNLAEGEYKFNCWKCGKRVKADIVIALADRIDASESEIREVLEERREELDPPEFVRDLTEEDLETARERQKANAPLFPSEVDDPDEWYDQFD